MNRRNLLLCAALILAFAIGRQALYSRSERSVLDHTQDFTLYSLSGHRPTGKPTNTFHNYEILGQTKITDPTVKAKLTNTLYSAIKTSVVEDSACFNPRHGIRATWNGRNIDAEICFECGKVYFYENDRPSSSWSLSNEPQKTFDAVLVAAHLPLAR